VDREFIFVPLGTKAASSVQNEMLEILSKERSTIIKPTAEAKKCIKHE
jgi:hypothetical protein